MDILTYKKKNLQNEASRLPIRLPVPVKILSLSRTILSLITSEEFKQQKNDIGLVLAYCGSPLKCHFLKIWTPFPGLMDPDKFALIIAWDPNLKLSP